ncbi:hypothetical protein EPN42_13035 [bacterium]|nr:MAG: hypothetical protein EPN42_13035 [bacterium]
MTVHIAAATPFSARTTGLHLPDRVVPGTPFACRLEIKYEHDAPCVDAILLVEATPNVRIVPGSVRLDSRPTSAMPRDGRELRLPLPPLAPWATCVVTWEALMEVPAAHDSVGRLYTTILARGASLAVHRETRAVSSVAFDPARTFAAIDGDDALAVGEKRMLRVVVHQEGTATADRVRLEAVDVMDVDLGVLGGWDHLEPGDTRLMEVPVVVTGAEPTVRLRLVYNGGSFNLPELNPSVVAGPSLRGTLERDGALPIAPAGGIIPLHLVVKNTGGRPAVDARLLLELPPGSALRGQTGVLDEAEVALGTIDPGEEIERGVLIELAPHPNPVVRGRLECAREAAVEMEPLALPIETVVSFVVHAFEMEGSLIVGGAAATRLEVLHDGNVVADALNVALTFGESLAYMPGSLRVNGLLVDDARFEVEGSIGFRKVRAGSIIALSWLTMPTRATVRGTTTAIGAALRWASGRATATTVPQAVTPDAIHADDPDGLPFELDEEETWISRRDDGRALAGEGPLFTRPALTTAAPPAGASDAGESGAADQGAAAESGASEARASVPSAQPGGEEQAAAQSSGIEAAAPVAGEAAATTEGGIRPPDRRPARPMSQRIGPMLARLHFLSRAEDPLLATAVAVSAIVERDSEGDPALAPMFARGVSTLRTMTATTLQRPSGEPPTASEWESLRQSLSGYAIACADRLQGFRSLDAGQPSVLACLAAVVTTIIEYPADAPWALQAESYAHGLIGVARRLDNELDETSGESLQALTDPLPLIRDVQATLEKENQAA